MKLTGPMPSSVLSTFSAAEMGPFADADAVIDEFNSTCAVLVVTTAVFNMRKC